MIMKRSPLTRQSRTSAFTLIELLVVIAIIAILAAILFPVFAQARAKARAITCLSNEKEIGLGMMMYFQDYDESAPFFRIVGDGDWWTSRMMNWKDLIYPYLKSGGRPYNNGQPYKDQGNGGLFICPENSAAWSGAPVWWDPYNGSGGVGDESTRFPRGYAVNTDAGSNENGLPTDTTGGRFWPCVGDGSCSKNQGALASLQTPAGTIMVAETRLPFPDISSEFMTYECTLPGIPSGGTGYSCVQGHHGGFTNAIFFDGHAKAVRAQTTMKDDLWDTFGPRALTSTKQAERLSGVNNIKEWNPGY